MPTIIPTDRKQLTFMNSLDDMVAPDHPIRLMDALIDRIVEQDPDYFNHLAPQQVAGRRGYSADGSFTKLMSQITNWTTQPVCPLLASG